MCYCLPWTPAIVYTLGFAADSAHPLTALQVTPFVFYSFAMLLVMAVTILLGIGRKDGLQKNGPKDRETIPAKADGALHAQTEKVES